MPLFAVRCLPMQKITAPPGMEFVRTKDGSYALRPMRDYKEPTAKTISFRLPTSMYVTLLALTETFEHRSWAEAMRWIVTLPEVQEAVRQRVRESSRPRQPVSS